MSPKPESSSSPERKAISHTGKDSPQQKKGNRQKKSRRVVNHHATSPVQRLLRRTVHHHAVEAIRCNASGQSGKSDVIHRIRQICMHATQPRSAIPIELGVRRRSCIVTGVELPIEVHAATFTEEICKVGRRAQGDCLGGSAVQVAKVVRLG